MSFEISPGFFKRRERPWDVGLTSDQRFFIYQRRRDPDGVQHEVGFRRDGRVVYPWDAMQDGDYFIAEVGSRSIRSMEVAFRQAAARHDIEIAIHPGTIDGYPAFRVTRVFKGVSKAKRRARGMGIHAPSFDVDRRRRAPRSVVPQRRHYSPPDVEDAPGDTSPPTGDTYDRAALLERARREAKEELGGRSR